MPGQRRGMAEFLQEQRAHADDGPVESADSPSAPVSAVLSPSPVPTPYSAISDDPLDAHEQADLTVCEAAVDNLRRAFWLAGKALNVIRDARLYRDSDATFEAYVERRWDISRAQAYRLIDAWPLAEHLSPMGDINERQTRELLPVATRHGQDAAVTVYRAVAEAGVGQVTAALLHGAVAVLPGDRFDTAEVVKQIRAYLAGGVAAAPSRPAAGPVERFTVNADRALRGLHLVTAANLLAPTLDAEPAAVRRVIVELRAVLADLEQRVGDSEPVV